MAKRKRANNERQNEKKRKEGCGEGSFEKYKPWINTQDIASLGLVTRLMGSKTGRIHHLLSTLELDYFHIIDWVEQVIDIKEQFPLYLPETLALAKEVGLIHPPRSNPDEPIVMTTDFLITVRQSIGTREVARTLKYSKYLTSRRVLEKFEIEHLYWKERNIDWGIVTELDINKTLVKNIKWLYPFRKQGSLPHSITSSVIPKLTDYLLPIIKEKQISLRNITKACDEKFRLPLGSTLSFVRYLLATRKWRVDMLKPVQPEEPLNIIFGNFDGEKTI